MARMLSLLLALAFSGTVYVENYVKDPVPLQYVASLGDDNESIKCSAVKISPRRVLTAAHCIDDPKQNVWINRKWVFTPIRIDSEADLALLEIKGPAADPFKTWAPLAETPDLTDDLVSIGFPLAEGLGHFVVERGEYMGISTAEWTKGLALTTVPVYPGNSGGGMFVWEQGEWKLAGVSIAIAIIPTGPYSIQILPKLSFIRTQLKDFLYPKDAS